MFLRGAKRRRGLLGHALLGNSKMDLRPIGKLFARADNRFLEQFLRLCEFLLMEMLHSLLVELQLLFEMWIDHLPDCFGVRCNFIISLIFQ